VDKPIDDDGGERGGWGARQASRLLWMALVSPG